jgi:hypothetical protein
LSIGFSLLPQVQQGVQHRLQVRRTGAAIEAAGVTALHPSSARNQPTRCPPVHRPADVRRRARPRLKHGTLVICGAAVLPDDRRMLPTSAGRFDKAAAATHAVRLTAGGLTGDPTGATRRLAHGCLQVFILVTLHDVNL